MGGGGGTRGWEGGGGRCGLDSVRASQLLVSNVLYIVTRDSTLQAGTDALSRHHSLASTIAHARQLTCCAAWQSSLGDKTSSSGKHDAEPHDNDHDDGHPDDDNDVDAGAKNVDGGADDNDDDDGDDNDDDDDDDDDADNDTDDGFRSDDNADDAADDDASHKKCSSSRKFL